MKKTKLLIPALAIAGLGATVAPMVAMTSCNNNKAQQITMTFDSTISAYASGEKSWTPGQYTAKFTYEPKWTNGAALIGYKGMGSLQKDSLTVKIDGVEKEKFIDSTTGLIKVNFGTSDTHTIELSWSIDFTLTKQNFVFMSPGE